MKKKIQPVGGTGGYTSLYLVNEKQEGKDKVQNNIYNNNKQANLNKVFTYASLFSGIGGFEQALNRLGGKCVFASEIDKFASQAYDVLYGHKPHGDITQIEASDVPDHDLLVGGFPCQAFSVAGQRKGFDDTRGTLFFEVARIAKEKQPKALLLENVKGLVNHDKGKTLDVIFETLNEIGYTVDFEVLNSKYFGVPQNRERIFIVAIRDDLIETEKWTEDQTNGQTVVAKGKRRISDYEWAKTFNFDFPSGDKVTTRLRDILETDVDEKYYLSDDKTAKLVAQLEANPSEDDIPLENMGRLAGLRNRTDRVFAYQGDKKRSTAQENIYLRDDAIADSVTVGHMPKYINAEPQMLGHVDIKGHDAIKRVYSAESVGPTLTTMGGGHREPKIAEPCVNDRGTLRQNSEGVSNAVDANYAKGFDNHGQRTHVLEGARPAAIISDDGLNRKARVRKGEISAPLRAVAGDRPGTGIGEEVRPVLTPDREEKRQNGRRFKENEEEAFTLTAQDKHGIAIGKYPRYRIRKLTPRECWRLQGFPDEAHDAVEKAGISDSQRYKMAGNAVTVNVIEAISERLLPYIINK